jgi:alpha-tubulin suppressor-like RCC1 family protein
MIMSILLISGLLSALNLSVATSATAKINYVALGDSYSSGEGLAAQATGYISNLGYNTGNDGCHRASDAYPELVKKSFGNSLGSFTFVACSGAYSGATASAVAAFDQGGSMVSGRDKKAPQLSTKYLAPSVNDISLTIGGNDAGFAKVAISCASIMLKTGPIQEVTGIPPSLTGGSCASRLALSNKVIGDGTATSNLAQGLISTYEAILNDAPNARLAVLTYPQILTPKQIPTSKFCPLTGGMLIPKTDTTAYLGFNSKVQGDFDTMETAANSDITSAVAAVALLPEYQGRIRVVDTTSITSSYAQPCNTTTMSQSDINGIDLALGDGIIQLYRCIFRTNSGASCMNLIATRTLHPTKIGHERMASALEAAFGENWNSTSKVLSVVGEGKGYCALLTSGGVDCWGYGYAGELGNGQFYTSGNGGSAVPVAVVSTSGSGTLSDVASLIADGGYCALLTSGGVDCWGYGADGALGDGQLSDSAIPVAVVSTSGSGALRGVNSLAADNEGGNCAQLTSGGVDCWGYGADGALGDGQLSDSAVPVTVVGTSGSGTLNGVADLDSDNGGFCARLGSGGVDCWGNGNDGELGNGQFYTSGIYGSAVPVAVVSTSGSGTLSGVADLDSDSGGYCALLTSGGVDCWGFGYDGELGNGQFYTSGNEGSAVPVAVVSTSGSGTLGNVASLTGGGSGEAIDSYCALLTSGEVDCWGFGGNGNLGNGQFYPNDNDGSAVPVAVVSTSGSGTLDGVASLAGDGTESYCALLTSGEVDCWGGDVYGNLGNGQSSDSAVPVTVTFPPS